MTTIHIVPTTVGEHLLPYAINGDASGLSDAEVAEFDSFQNALAEDAPDGFTFGHFSVGDDQGFTECEVSGWDGQCVTLEAVYFRRAAA